VGFDPCLVAKEKDIFSEYSEVSIEFQPVKTIGNFNRLLLDRCQVVECGVRLLHAKRAMLPDRDMIWGNGFDDVTLRRKKRRHIHELLF
jgi:hypothetical protein